MSTVPTVIVRKGGFLSAFFSGLFGFLIAVVVCASGLGLYALHVVDSKLDSLFGMPGEVISGLSQWQQNLPRLVAETLDDRRAPEYRDQIAITVQTVPSPEHSSREVTVVGVTNNGSETITVLALNITLEDANGVPISERCVYAATPIALDEDPWRGPLLPAESRRFIVQQRGSYRSSSPRSLESTVSVAEIRLWTRPAEKQPASSCPAGQVAVMN
jgi:hypothetical protein